MNAAPVARGIPVALDRIERALKELWREAGGAVTRASLINFAICAEGEQSLETNSALIAEFVRRHACRALLLATVPGRASPQVQAWIGAHCHVSRAGAKQICCEQVSFLLAGDPGELIPAVLLPHLDSDLPLYLWWQYDFPAHHGERLWPWVDRLIYDSLAWRTPAPQLALLFETIAPTAPRTVFCDLNWARLLEWREAVARFFDAPATLPLLQRLERVRIVHHPDARMTALLLAGWLAAQLALPPVRMADGALHAGHTAIELEPGGGRVLGAVHLEAGATRVAVRCCVSGDFLETRATHPGGGESVHLTPRGKDDPLALLDRELARGGRHHVYLKALAAARVLLG